MVSDLKHSLRQLRRSPGVMATVVIGPGNRSHDGHLHAGAPGDAQVASGGETDELWRIGDKIRCCNWGGYTQDNDGDFSLFSWEAYKNFREHTQE